MFFTSLVNVEEHLNRIGTIIHRKEFNLLRHEVKILGKYILLITGKHNSLHPEVVAKLLKVKDKLEGLNGSVEQAERNFPGIRKEFSDIFILTPVYLLRHPENATEKSRNLSFNGIRQAKGVAEYLAEECLLCPKPVRVYLFCSDLRRTYLFASVIQKKINQLVHFYDKKVIIEPIVQHPALYFRFTQDGLKEMSEDYGRNEFLAFTKWMQGQYHLLPDAQRVAEEVAAWIREGRVQANPGEWSMIVGISHSFIIDTLLVQVTQEHRSIIPTVGFAEFVGNKMFYNKKWYTFR